MDGEKMQRGAARLLLAAVFSLGLAGTAAADTLKIAQVVYDSYQEYLKRIGTNKTGAFAVSLAGNKSYNVYCTNETCLLTDLAREAMQKCEQDTQLPCTLLATNRDQKIQFEIFNETSAVSSGDPLLSHVLDVADVKAKIVGSTIRGEYPNHVKWEEYYDPSGRIRGKDEEHGAYSLPYTLDGNKLCYDYPGNDQDWCATFSLQGDDLQFLKDGKLVNFTINSKLVPGNPDQL
jgi:hypothetical protein